VVKKPSLAETHPELAEQAVGWDPESVTKGSHKKLAWVCYFGHRWTAEVKSRALIGAGCPYCDGKLAVTGVNDLETLYPEIAAQARGWDPSVVNPTSHKKREFECGLGHRYVQGVRRRVEATGCPVCQNDQILIGFNDLATTHPDLAVEADGWDPKSVVAGTPRKMDWKCLHGHRWRIGVYARAMKGNGCPYCSGRRAIEGVTDIATSHPDIASQLVEADLSAIKGGTNKKVKWKCDRGHLWMATPSSRTGSKTGCPFCSGLKVIEGETDLQTTHPELAKQARGWEPKKYSKGSDKKAQWECERGHSWSAVISSRVSGVGCPYCSGARVIVGETDLETLHPGIAIEANGWDPSKVGVGGGKKLWTCQIGHDYMASVSNRTYMGSGCPYCSNKEVLVGFNDLLTTHPEIAKEANGWDPTTVTAGSGKKRSWVCQKRHVWVVPVSSRLKNSCPVCANKSVLPGYNDLQTTHPMVAAEADGWDPTTVTAGSNKKQNWKCENGHVWEAVVASRAKGINAKNKSSGCPSCAKFGFKPESKAWLYLLEHIDWGLLQIGISNDIKRRLEKHTYGGWNVIELRGPMEGYLAKALESDSLTAIRSRGGVFANKSNLKKFDGYTEAWTKGSLNVTSIKQILDWVYEDEGKVVS
jgi:DNA-directed RNA polymerase subunit RPC12/RpoP